MPFTVDHRTCFQICCKAVWTSNSMPWWTLAARELTLYPMLFTIYLLLVWDKSLWIQSMFITLYAIIHLGVHSDGSPVYVFMYVCVVVEDERVTWKTNSRFRARRKNLPDVSCGFFERQLETAVWHFEPPCWTKTKLHSSPNNNIWSCLTAWINKQALWTLNPPQSITLTPSSPIPPCHPEGCRLLVWDWHISTDSVHPIN